MTSVDAVARAFQAREPGGPERAAPQVFAVALFLLLVSACAPKQKYVAPSVDTTPAFKENANWKAPQPQDAAIRGAWWEVFNDAPLNALEARVDVTNQNLKAAEAQFAQSRALLRGARSGLYPQVRTSPSIAADRQSGNRAFSSFHDAYADYLLPVDVSYEADVWGRVRGIIESSRTFAQATAADLETVRLSVHAELALDYFTLRGLDRLQDLLDSTVAAYERALELTNNRFRGGLASQADVALAETQLESTRAQAIDVEASRAALEHAIAVLVGETPSTFSIAHSPLDGNPPAVPVGMPTQLLERRSDIASAERRVASASAQVGVATSAYYPLLTLSAVTGFESSTLGSLLASASNFWVTGPVAVASVFDAGRRRANAAEARAAYEQSVAGYRLSVLSAFREVEDQLAALRVLEQEAAVQDAAVAAAERSLTLANNRYRGGVTSYLEVITAQSAALVNQRAAVSVLIRRMTATVLLLKALGGGWNATSLPLNASR